MNCVRGLCNARTCRSRSWGRNAIQRSLGELRVLSHQVLDDALNNIALTSQCTGDLKNPPMEVSGAARQAAGARGRTRHEKAGGTGRGTLSRKEKVCKRRED